VIWAVNDLAQIGRALGQRMVPIRKEATSGRNDPCPFGSDSSKKFKKCHRAG